MGEPPDPHASRSPWAPPGSGSGDGTTDRTTVDGPTADGTTAEDPTVAVRAEPDTPSAPATPPDGGWVAPGQAPSAGTTHYDAPSDAGTRQFTTPQGQPAWPQQPYQQQPYQAYQQQPFQQQPYPQQPYQQHYPQQPYPPGAAPPPGYGPPQGPPTTGWAPPGAQPGWGGPHPPRQRRPFPWKVVGIVAGVLVLIALIVVGLLAFVVGPRFARVDVLDADAVAQGVTRVVGEDWRRQITGVSCPSDQQVRPGVRFTCSATVDGRPVQVPVQVVDADGTYSVGQPR